MNQISNTLCHIAPSIDELTIEKLVTASGIRKEADRTKFSFCVLQLQAMYLNIVHADQHPSKNLRETVNRELVSLSKNLGKVHSCLNQTAQPNLLDALEATSVDLNFLRATVGEAPIQ